MGGDGNDGAWGRKSYGVQEGGRGTGRRTALGGRGEVGGCEGVASGKTGSGMGDCREDGVQEWGRGTGRRTALGGGERWEG